MLLRNIEINELQTREKRNVLVDFIPMFKEKEGGFTSRNYHECDLKIRNFSFLWSYIIRFTINQGGNILNATDYIKWLSKQIFANSLILYW